MAEPIITTARLELRPFVDSDLDGFAAMYADPEVMRYVHGEVFDRQRSAEALRRMEVQIQETGVGLMATVLRATGELVGRCGFHWWSIELKDELEIGWLIRRDLWGQGLATEVGIALRDHGFDVLGHQRLISVIEPGNDASIRVAEKVGETLWKTIEHKDKKVLVYAVASPRG